MADTDYMMLTPSNALIGLTVMHLGRLSQGRYTLDRKYGCDCGTGLKHWFAVNDRDEICLTEDDIDKWVIVPDDEPEPQDVDPLEIAQNAMVMILGFERLVDEGIREAEALRQKLRAIYTIETKTMAMNMVDVFKSMKKIIDNAKPKSPAAPAQGPVPDLNP